MTKQYDKIDEYYLYIFKRIFDLAPIIGLAAALTFSMAYAVGLFAFATSREVIVFDIVCCTYFIASAVVKKYSIVENGEVSQKKLVKIGMLFDVVLLIQWNLITYIFPTESFWGYAPLFVILSAFTFNTKVVLVEITGISVSIAASWLLIGDKLLPPKSDLFIENMVLRGVALIVTFTVIYIVTHFAEMFTVVAKENSRSLEIQNAELEKMGTDIIEFTADIIEERDSTSGSHVKRLKNYTYILAHSVKDMYPEYGLTDDIIDEISLASVLHDVGKIAIPDNILNKPGKLTDEEFEIIKTHTTHGAHILDKLPDSVGESYKKYCREICLYHHEKYDGTGYPIGLVGDDIPIAAQIVSAVDCYDALTSERPYKGAYPGTVAIKMILDEQCGKFSDKMKSAIVACKEQLLNS